MIHVDRPSPARRSALALAASLMLALPLALASGGPRIDAAGVPFADSVTVAGADLAWDGGLVLVLGAEGHGALGDVAVPAYDADLLAVDAFDRIVVAEAVGRSAIVASYPGGIAFTHRDIGVDALVAAYLERLTELGFATDHQAGARSFAFVRDGVGYRAVFGATDAGVEVYLGI